MSEFANKKDPLFWRVIEGLAINLLIAISAIIGFVMILFECFRDLFSDK